MTTVPGDDDPGPDGAAGSGESRPIPGSLSDADLDYDAAFAALIAQFDDPPTIEAVSERGAEPNARPDDTAGSAPSEATPGPARPGLQPGPVADHNPPPPQSEPWYPAILDEHFEPTDPGPLPRGDLISRAAWAGVLGGPALLIVIGVLRGSAPQLMIMLAALGFIAGFVTLVVRMPAERDGDDDGAVV